jgi:hypothetical protein
VPNRSAVPSAPTRRGQRAASLLTALALLAGCDIPTSAPNWETRWAVRAEETTIPVASLLPGQVMETNGEFVISVSGGSISRSLGELCSACAPLNGMVAPKPAFSTTLESAVAFPVDLDSLVLTRGSIQVRVANHFGFDPIRPAAAPDAPRGQITITIRNGSTVLGAHTIDGATTEFAAGTTLLASVTFSPANLPRTIGGSVAFEVAISSPAGDPVTINTAQSLSVEAADAAIGASAAMVRVQGRPVTAAPMALDLSGLDAELTDRVLSGSLILDIDNPFAVEGILTATLSAPGVTLVRPLSVTPGTSQGRLTFSGDELRSLFGPTAVSLSVSGPLSAAPAGLVTLRPTQQLTASGRLELIVSTNSPEGSQ